MANPNPGPLSKWIFIITMAGAVAYIGAAFAWVILPEKESVVVVKTGPEAKTAAQPKKAEQSKAPKAEKPKEPKKAEQPKEPKKAEQPKEPKKTEQPKAPTEGGDPK